MDIVLRHSTSRPRLTMALCLAVILSVSWMALWKSAEASGVGVLDALCGPVGDAGLSQLVIVWLAMTLAMMIPSAMPMISTYLDIAEAAKAKDLSVVPPLVLAGGYGTVWALFAIVAALAQWGLQETDYTGTFADEFAAPLLVAAGAYQFTALKHSCLTKCRAPMPYFLANWSERPVAIFRVGVGQGLNCFGCCWALMGLSFVAGFMNAAWMAIIAVMMVLEKTAPQPKPLSYGLGLGLCGAGLWLISG